MGAPALLGTGSRSSPLNEEDLTYFTQLIERLAGIHLKPAKHGLVETRLRGRLNALGLSSYKDYRRFLDSASPNDPEFEIFTNLLTTNKTDFFREPKHFDHLIQTILPAWTKTNDTTFKVWVAASSTGEEAYTLGMVLSQHLPLGRDFRVLASDIDTRVLQTARNAVYPLDRRHEIPPDYAQRFTQTGKGEARQWFRIQRAIKDKIQFKQHNLIDRTAPGEDVFDLVLCRNVLIYFAPHTIDFVQAKLFKSTRPGGQLFLGHSESLQGLKHRWKSVAPAIFQKPAGR